MRRKCTLAGKSTWSTHFSKSYNSTHLNSRITLRPSKRDTIRWKRRANRWTWALTPITTLSLALLWDNRNLTPIRCFTSHKSVKLDAKALSLRAKSSLTRLSSVCLIFKKSRIRLAEPSICAANSNSCMDPLLPQKFRALHQARSRFFQWNKRQWLETKW